MRSYLLLIALTIPLLTTACRFGEKGTEAEDNTNPYFAQAEKLASEDNFYGAIDQYEKALQANGNVAKAYEKMGDIYSEKLGDYASAIYCYQKYLKIRPNAENKDLVANYLDKAKHDFVLSMPQSITPPGGEDFARLNSGTLAAATTNSGSGMNMTVNVATPAATQPATTTPVPVTSSTVSSNAAPATAVPPANTQGAKSYTIQKGDSLWKIAKKFYPEDVKGGVEKIKQANPQAAANDKGLKLGTTLVIP